MPTSNIWKIFGFITAFAFRGCRIWPLWATQARARLLATRAALTHAAFTQPQRADRSAKRTRARDKVGLIGHRDRAARRKLSPGAAGGAADLWINCENVQNIRGDCNAQAAKRERVSMLFVFIVDRITFWVFSVWRWLLREGACTQKCTADTGQQHKYTHTQKKNWQIRSELVEWWNKLPAAAAGKAPTGNCDGAKPTRNSLYKG